MTLSEYPLSVRDQGIGLNHWRQLGLEIPNLEKWRDLARYNLVSERSLPIETIAGEQTDRLFGAGTALVVSPDPDIPPTKRMMDILLGYAISGGNVTLVDGVSGFKEREGWWKAEGFRDPADYALQSIGVEHVPASRKVLDEEGLDEGVNTFCLGTKVSLEGRSETPAPARTTVPGNGFILISAQRDADEVFVQQGVRECRATVPGRRWDGPLRAKDIWRIASPIKPVWSASSTSPEIGGSLGAKNCRRLITLFSRKLFRIGTCGNLLRSRSPAWRIRSFMKRLGGRGFSMLPEQPLHPCFTAKSAAGHSSGLDCRASI
jgi:hypothetical protein